MRDTYDFGTSLYKPLDFIALTETWLDDGVSNSELFPDFYNVFRADRRYSAVGLTRGGGVLLAVHSDLKSSEIDVGNICPLFNSVQLVDIVGVKVCMNSHALNVFVVYIPPRVTPQLLSIFFEAMGVLLTSCRGRSVVVGDFNITKYAESLTSLSHDRDVKQLNNFCKLLDFKQTNFVKNSFNKILDLVLTSEPCSVVRAEDVLVEEETHHPALFIRLAIPSAIRNSRCLLNNNLSYNFRKADLPSLYKFISAVSWSSVTDKAGVNDAVDEFYAILYSGFEKYVSKTSPGRKAKYPPWFSSEIKQKIRSKYLCWRQYKRTGDIYLYQKFKELRAEIKNDIKICYSAFIHHTEVQIDSNPGKFWSFLNHKSGRQSFPSHLAYGDKSVDGVQGVVDAFASFFSDSFTNYTSCPGVLCMEDELLDKADSDGLAIRCIGDAEILQGFCKIKRNFSSGPDGIPGFIAFDSRFAFLKPLRHIFNLILATSCYPDRWKVSRVAPVFKKGDRLDISNYRPIAILDNLCKVLEFCLHNPMMNHVKTNISESQHGFIPGRSTTTNLFVVTQFISDQLDNSSQVDVIYTDFSRAFDRLNHNMLLNKLHRFGFSNQLVNLFKSYFFGRSQYVENQGMRSAAYTVDSGVPQGSILGPLFFNIFIDDIVSELSAHHLLYADDMKLFYQIRTPADCLRLQGDLDVVADWCDSNCLPLNASKCLVLSFHRIKKPLLFAYNIGQNILVRPSVVTDLGIIFDSQLTFVPHIEGITSKSHKCMGFLIRNGRQFKSDTLIRLFNAFVRSRLEYASLIWSPSYAVHINELESVLRKFLKFLAHREDGVYPEIGYPQDLLLQRFGLSSLERRRQYYSVTFLFKVVNSLVNCTEISRRLVFNTHRTGARHPTTFYLPLANTRSQQSSPLYTMCRAYCLIQHRIDIQNTSSAEIKSAFFSAAINV